MVSTDLQASIYTTPALLIVQAWLIRGLRFQINPSCFPSAFLTARQNLPSAPPPLVIYWKRLVTIRSHRLRALAPYFACSYATSLSFHIRAFLFFKLFSFISFYSFLACACSSRHNNDYASFTYSRRLRANLIRQTHKAFRSQTSQLHKELSLQLLSYRHMDPPI